MMYRLSFLIVVIFTLSLAGCSARKHAVSQSYPGPAADPDYSDPVTWVLGYFNRNQLVREPHSGWYLDSYDNYRPSEDYINNLKTIDTTGLRIKIVMGTWCPDSRREVPRFLRITDMWNFPEGNITFIGVDDTKNAPVGEYAGLNIERVPTFIIYRNNIEAGRIIENPKTSLEQDMVNILTGNEK
jgi:thiol-disulfide isomerase/thioredoxin